MKNKTVITIDPGASGGIALWAKGMNKCYTMPGSVVEMAEFFAYIKETYGGESTIYVFIEKVQAYSKGDDAPGKKFGINKMLKNYNQLLTVIQLAGLQFIEVYPVSWQSTLGLKFKNVEKMPFPKFKAFRKNKYKEFAQKSFPELKVTLKTADALCLLSFAFIKFANDTDWVCEKLQNIPKKSFFK